MRAEVMTFQEFVELITSRFTDLPQHFYVEYKDEDGDKIRINCEDDFLILMEEQQNAKTIKIFVTESLNQSESMVLTNVAIFKFSKNS